MEEMSKFSAKSVFLILVVVGELYFLRMERGNVHAIIRD
jgi:hypothetical protein